MKIYSPTQTDAFAFCPQYREWYKQGWQPRIADKPMIARWLGVAMAVGQEHYYSERAKLSAASTYTTSAEASLASLEGLVATFRGVGGVVEESLLMGLPSAITKVFQTYPDLDPIPANWEIVAVEHAFTEYGNARADLLVRTPSGLTVVDWKWKRELYVKSGETRDQARGRTLMEYDHFWNMYHYVWALQQTATEPVALEYYIGLGELSPRKVTLQKFQVSPKEIDVWVQDAKTLWWEMGQVDNELWRVRGNVSHGNKYGKCMFYDVCVLGNKDESWLPAKFVQIARRKEST